MSRVYNFSAGPAVLPESVLQEAAAEMLDYRGTGMSVMEMSHRSKTYQAIIDQAEADLRTLTKFLHNTGLFIGQCGKHHLDCSGMIRHGSYGNLLFSPLRGINHTTSFNCDSFA